MCVLVDLFCPPPPPHHHCFAHPPSRLSLISVFREIKKGFFLEGAKRAIFREMAFFNGKKSALEKKRFYNGQKTTFFLSCWGFHNPT
jgi:hypothetical protein